MPSAFTLFLLMYGTYGKCTAHSRSVFGGLKNKFQVFGRFDILVHVLKELLRGDTGIDLRGGYIGVPQHPADGFNRHSGFQRNQRGEGVT